MNEFVEYVRNQFPALDLTVNDYPAVFLDGPGGYQVPYCVIDAVKDYMINKNANVAGAYLTSRQTVETIQSAREAFAESDPASTIAPLKEAIQAIRDMIYKEEHILYPASLDMLSDQEWIKVKEESKILHDEIQEN